MQRKNRKGNLVEFLWRFWLNLRFLSVPKESKDTQTEGDENILGGMQSDTKAEMEMMKKMFQGRIKTLTETLEKEKAAYEKNMEAEKKKQIGLNADLVRAGWAKE